MKDSQYEQARREGQRPENEPPPQKDRGFYGCALDEDGHCMHAGTEYCSFTCPFDSTPTDEQTKV
jgi:hypothetical protein